MSRNKEKNNSLLAQWYAQQGPAMERPRRTESAESAYDAERFRKMCMNEINSMLVKIDDPLAGEYQLRELNTKLNKLMREKRAWEYRIRELGGPDYTKSVNDIIGSSSSFVNGYRYFGRARELPDVKKLLAKRSSESRKHKINEVRRKGQKDVAKRLDAVKMSSFYYGRHDEDYEQEKNKHKGRHAEPGVGQGSQSSPSSLEEYEASSTKSMPDFDPKRDAGSSPEWEMPGQDAPTDEEVSKWVIQRRKEQLLARLKK